MKITFTLLLACFLCCTPLLAQFSPNGEIEDIRELASRITVPFTMPDSTQLMTDVTLPILRDSLVINHNLSVPLQCARNLF